MTVITPGSDFQDSSCAIQSPFSQQGRNKQSNTSGSRNPGKAEPTPSCSVTGEFEIEIEEVHVRVFPWNIAHELSNNLKPTNGIRLAAGSCLAARCSHLGVVWVDESPEVSFGGPISGGSSSLQYWLCACSSLRGSALHAPYTLRGVCCVAQGSESKAK
jgi:hypothetical protein